MSEVFTKLLALLNLDQVAPDHFRGAGPGGTRKRLFGGHVAAQALMAAGRTLPGMPAHSLHAYFLRMGDAGKPIDFQVQRLRDGRSFAARSVVALQDGAAILHASLSFHRSERGFEHQAEMPVVPLPAACPSWEAWVAPRLAELSEEMRLQLVRERPIELRPVDPVSSADPEPAGTAQSFWCRAAGTMPDDELLHQCVAVYASDHTLLSCVLRPHGRNFMSERMMVASLDHAIWFHRPFRMDQWLLYAQRSPVAAGARGLAFGHFFDAQGTLVASMAQEGVIRQT